MSPTVRNVAEGIGFSDLVGLSVFYAKVPIDLSRLFRGDWQYTAYFL